MISLNLALRVLKNHIRLSMADVPAGVSTPTENIPAYTCDKYGLPPICKASQSQKEIRAICGKFYKSLDSGEQEAICPFGIKISYLKPENTPKAYGFFIQKELEREAFDANTIQSLNRVPKKAVKKALADTHLFKFSSNNESETLNLLMRTLETLLAGRVAASMRVLTHQILTSVQGAINDVEQIKLGNVGAIPRLEDNIEETSSIAKQIHILMSEDLAPTRQSVRPVPVRDVIRKICSRLESLAAKSDLSFEEHVDSHITTVEAVPDRLRIVFKCLLENAAKYSFHGLSHRKRIIRIRYRDAITHGNANLQVFIENYGCRITESEIRERKVFDLGYRGEFSGDRGRQGTGSGLYICERIVRAHGGQILITSRIDTASHAREQAAINTVSVIWPRDFSD